MGYRLNIDELKKGCLENVYYGTKLYGYKDESNFISFKYLLTLGKIDEDTLFDYSSDFEIPLNSRELYVFLILYNLDMNQYSDYIDEKDSFLNVIEIKNLLNKIKDEYYGCYVISWY